MVCRIITLSPFRAFLGIAIIAVALIDLSIHEIHLGKLLTPKYDVIKEAVLNLLISGCNN